MRGGNPHGYPQSFNPKEYLLMTKLSIITALVILVAVPLFGTLGVRAATWKEDVRLDVTGAERVCTSSGESTICQYLVYTEQGTYRNTDDMLAGKFRSADLHGKLKNGGCYISTTVGYRLGITGSYPNIISVVPCP